MSSAIYSVTAREILDSRGNPTIEACVILESGYRGVAGVPSGASVSSFEAIELRDNDPSRYNGMGVLKAVANVNNLIQPVLKGKDSLKQAEIDNLMIELDGTPNKKKIGANAILAVSMANAIAASNFKRIPLYIYINSLFSALIPTKIERIPTPTFNMINGGKHGAGNLDFQEFHVVPASNKPFSTALQIGVEIFHATNKMLSYRNAIHSVGDEGGFAPNLTKNVDAFEILSDSIKTTKYHIGVDVFFGLDVASTNFSSDRGYQIKDRPIPYSREEFIQYLSELNDKYKILNLEDALTEDDWDGWVKLTKTLGEQSLIVGDDFLATNPKRLETAISKNACSCLLAKPNQIGSLTEFLHVIEIAKKHNIKIITSHRSGETTDNYLSDIAVAIQSEYVKFGAPNRGERITKFNRLLQIEQELFGTNK